MDSIPETLTVPEAARFCGITRREAEYRMNDATDPRHLAWIDRKPVDGKRGRLVLFKGLPEEAKKRVWDEVRKHLASQELATPHLAPIEAHPTTKALNATSLPTPPEPASSEQQAFGFAQVDPAIKAAVAALAIRPEDVPLVQFRKDFVMLAQNHKFMSEGFSSSRALIEHEIAKARAGGIRHISYRSVLRWRKDYEDKGDAGLVDAPPGPKPGKIRLESWQVTYIEQCCAKGMGQAATCRAVAKETAIRQQGAGLDYRYTIPSRDLVRKVWKAYHTALQDAASKGSAQLKAACGSLDRTYAHLASLDVVEVDEWEFNAWAYDFDLPLNVYRYWLLVAYDQRSMYPLAWKMVKGRAGDKRHGISEDDEIDLLERLIREYGVPKSIYSDRGRFRGRTYESRKKREAEFEEADTLWENLGIDKGGPEDENPRASRIHPFFKWLSGQCEGLPGYCGREPKDVYAEQGWAAHNEHIEWCKGDRGSSQRSPYLLSNQDLLARMEEWIADWREHLSDGTDMRGLSPRAVFTHNIPEGGFRKLSEEDMALKFAETFEEETIEPGGVIQLPDKKRYSNILLADIPGEVRTVKRLRHEKSFIVVLPTRPDGEYVIADLRRKFGDDQVALGAEIERQKHLRKVVMEYYAAKPPDPDRDAVSSVEYVAERMGLRKRDDVRFEHREEPVPLEACELTAEELDPEEFTPSLHEMEQFTPEMEES